MNVRRAARGYTVVEVMIALAILAVGTTGIISMQKVTAVANRDGKNLLVANQIARTWIERLRADAVQWNHPSPFAPMADRSDLEDDTKWLKQIFTTTDWFRPVDDVRGSPTADALGNDVRDVNVSDGVYCTNIRLNWLYGPPPGTPPPYLIRAEVRVYWLRDGGGGVVDPGKPICDSTILLATVGRSNVNYHFVYVTTAITQNTARGI